MLGLLEDSVHIIGNIKILFCLGKMNNFRITPGFHHFGLSARIYFLDTNVWSSLASSTKALNAFLPWLQKNNAIAALSMFTVFELSRAENMLKDFDRLLNNSAQRIYIPLLYDELSSLEMHSYPNEVELLWSPLTSFSNRDEIKFVSTISKDPRFVSKRQEFLEFGYTKFMNLEGLKSNFPLEDNDGKFSVENAESFAWANTLSYLLHYFPEYLLLFKGRLHVFDTSKLKSIYIRSLFLYFKYYVHEQSPNKSDFMDFAHVSYLPYVDTYVTERNALNTLSHIKASYDGILKCDLLHVRAFVNEIEHSLR